MKRRYLVLGAGFGGLELSTILSEALGDTVEVTLIDQAEAFVFGFSKLDVMFGHARPEAVRLPYREFVKSGVRVLRETVTAIDPAARRVTTSAGVHEADVLVVALGAEYDIAATPGLVLGINEYYSVPGAEHFREVLPTFTRGEAVIGVCGAPFKCPPAPSETALMLHDYLTEKGVRSACGITLVLPLGSPVPPSPETSAALVAAFAERKIRLLCDTEVAAVDEAKHVVRLDNGTELPCDCFLGVPRHRAPAVVRASGLADGDWVTVNPRTLATKFPGVYAVGDVAKQGTPKAGVFAEGAAKALGATLIAAERRAGEPGKHTGTGTCYIEFGGGRIASVEVDFFSHEDPTGTFHEPSTALRAQKTAFGASRRARWFGRA